MKILHKGLLLTGVLLFGLPAQAVQHAFLVQNSGWMEPFFTDPQSQLKPLVAALAQAVTTEQDSVSTLAFSQTAGSNQSPKLLLQSAGGQGIAQALTPLQVARKGDGGPKAPLADTDFKEAILGTITGPFQGASGIVWIFTNNKNSPNNDPQTRERNRDFYHLLHTEPAITKTLAFPLRMPVRSPRFQAQGLMVYALAYGAPAAQALDVLLAQGRIAQVLTKPPARLKPLDQEAVRILPQAVRNNGSMRTSLGSDQRTVMLDVTDPAQYQPEVILLAALRNQFYPYVIASAQTSGQVQSPLGSTLLQVTPTQVEQLEPGADQAVEVSFKLPMPQIPSAWSWQALGAMGKQVLIPMTAELSLQGQQLRVADSFTQEMQTIFPGDPISEVFTPPQSVQASRVKIPLVLRVQYPLLPVFLALGGVLALLGGLLAFGILGQRSKRFTVHIDGMARTVALKPFARLVLRNPEGQEVGEVQRSWQQLRVIRTQEGHTLSVSAR